MSDNSTDRPAKAVASVETPLPVVTDRMLAAAWDTMWDCAKRFGIRDIDGIHRETLREIIASALTSADTKG